MPMLIEQGYQVHACSWMDEPPESVSDNVTWHSCDLLNPGSQAELLEKVKPTHLLHLAWYTKHGLYWSSPENLRWVQASLALLNNFKKQCGQRIVIAGSCAEYDWEYGFCSESLTPTKPHTLYGECKNSLRAICASYCKEMSLSWAWGRIFFAYGPYEAVGRLIPYTITSLLKDEKTECGNGTLVRDYLHVWDVASALVRILESDVVGPVNIASSEPVTIETIVGKIADLLGKRHLVEFGAYAKDVYEAPLIVGDTRKLRSAVGWKPDITLHYGLQTTIGWWERELRGYQL